jgi:O-antigen/teichoic acid export membrane protein
MSRVRRFALSLASGYGLLAINVVYSLLSVRLGLDYLQKEGFGLWVVVMQAAGYLQLLDLGMSGSIFRMLVDHKDKPGDGIYGSYIKTGFLVLLAQGLIAAVGGSLVGIWLPGWLAVPVEEHRTFQILFGAQCVLLGILLPLRVGNYVLQAHQRFDLCNYTGMANQLLTLAVLWAGLALGFGIYSLLAAAVVGNIIGNLLAVYCVIRLRLLPPNAAAWGRVQWKVFKELFSYGSDVFLVNLGYQLLNATQLIIVSRSLGLAGAAVWAACTRTFFLAQQIVGQLVNFSTAAFSEMIVQGEQVRLRERFRDLLILTASASVFLGIGLAVCNGNFVQVWLAGRVEWNPLNDWLLGALLVVTSLSRCHICFHGLTKRIGSMRYVYPLEGGCFFLCCLWLVPRFGMTAILVIALISDVVWSGVYGGWRTSRYFGEPLWRVTFGWLRTSWAYLAAVAPLGLGWWWITQGLQGAWKLFLVRTTGVGLAALVLFWCLGLRAELRAQIKSMVCARLGRFRKPS